MVELHPQMLMVAVIQVISPSGEIGSPRDDGFSGTILGTE